MVTRHDENTECFKAIVKFYGNEAAKRSGVPLINHIREGLKVLDDLNASFWAKEAYCIHPIFQSDEELEKNWETQFFNVPCAAIALTMEYRSVANASLSTPSKFSNEIRLSPIPEVNQMLIADKVQNRKDFLLYHKGKHKNSEVLDFYFNQWLKRLGVSEEDYERYVAIMEKPRG